MIVRIVARGILVSLVIGLGIAGASLASLGVTESNACLLLGGVGLVGLAVSFFIDCAINSN